MFGRGVSLRWLVRGVGSAVDPFIPESGRLLLPASTRPSLSRCGLVARCGGQWMPVCMWVRSACLAVALAVLRNAGGGHLRQHRYEDSPWSNLDPYLISTLFGNDDGDDSEDNDDGDDAEYEYEYEEYEGSDDWTTGDSNWDYCDDSPEYCQDDWNFSSGFDDADDDDVRALSAQVRADADDTPPLEAHCCAPFSSFDTAQLWACGPRCQVPPRTPSKAERRTRRNDGSDMVQIWFAAGLV